MISGWNRLERAILGPLQPQKLPKLAFFDCFSLFDAKLAIFWAGTRWNSHMKVKTKVMPGLSPATKSVKAPIGLQKD